MKGLLLRALESGEVLEMIYQSDKGELSQRRIKVLDITNGTIKAFCLLRNRQRFFKTTNILSIGPIRKSLTKGA